MKISTIIASLTAFALSGSAVNVTNWFGHNHNAHKLAQQVDSIRQEEHELLKARAADGGSCPTSSSTSVVLSP
jgi:hypothetical protein